MYMSSPSERMESVVCVVLYLLCVLSVSGRENIYEISGAHKGLNITVMKGSKVTVICKAGKGVRATWHFTSSRYYQAYTDHLRDKCIVKIKEAIPGVKYDCTATEHSITFNGINDQSIGTLKCSLSEGPNTTARYNISIFVSDDVPTEKTRIVETTTSLTAKTPSSETHPWNSDRTDSTSGVTTRTGREFSGDSNLPAAAFSGNIIYAIGAVGACIVLIIIAVIVIILLRARKRSVAEGNKSRPQASPEEIPARHEDVIDIGGDYAQVSDFSVTSKVVAENPVYETYDKEVSDVKLSDASAPENVSDVYSVVKKSEAGGEAPKPSDPDGVSDIYSVVQKCAKSQAAED